MRAVAVYPADRTMKIVDHPEPRPERDTDVLVEMLDVGVCGTDREIFVFTGVPGRKGRFELDAGSLMRRLVLENQLVFGTVNAGTDAFQAAITDLDRFHTRWPQQLRALITRRYPPDAAPALLAGPASGIKSVVSFAETT